MHQSPSLSYAYVGGSDAPEKPKLQLGFVPLIDSAPLIVAAVQDMGRRHGLQLTLHRQPSWAAIRDKLLSGELDAAQALYGMVYGVQLGLGGPQADMAILMTLNQNGQAISVRPALAAALQAGTSLAEVLATWPHKPVFAQTFPTGTHAMWLYYWLAAQGVHPLRDIRSIVLPPPQMPAALLGGELDGFCAGEPWHAVATASGQARTLIHSGEIWPDHPEKVLACRADFAALYPNTARALTATLLEACRWLDTTGHRQEMAEILASPEMIGLPADLLASRLTEPVSAGSLRFHADGAANFPYLSDGLWFLSQFQRWGMLPAGTDVHAVTRRINQLASYADAASSLGIALPEGTMRRSVLMDGVVWDGSEPGAATGQFPDHPA